MASNVYEVEYAKSGRSTCKLKDCKKQIGKDELRICKKTPNNFFSEDGQAVEWYHPSCIFSTLARAKKTTKKIEETGDLIGFEYLTDSDRKLVQDLIKDFKKNGEFKPKKGAKKDAKKEPKKELKKEDSKKDDSKKEKTISSIFNRKPKENEPKKEELPKKLILIGDNGTKISLDPKSKIILGRGDLTGIEDKKLSRKQIELEVDENNKVTVKRIGTNPSMVIPLGGEKKSNF